MNIIFLDFDGVLNTPKGYWLPECIEQLNRIVHETNSMVVVSSSWRISHGVDALRELLKINGFTGTIFGCIPDLRKEYNGKWMGVDRGVEIYAWIKMYAPDRYVAIDDISDDWMEDIVVKTEIREGLTKEIADKVIRRMNTVH